MTQLDLSYAPPRRVITFTVFESVVTVAADGTETCETRIRWTAEHDGRSYGDEVAVPGLTAVGYVMCQALYRAEATMAAARGEKET